MTVAEEHQISQPEHEACNAMTKSEDSDDIFIRATIGWSVVTGAGFRCSAESIKGLRYDAARGGMVGAQGLARLARFVWLMGASDDWRTNGRSFDELCRALDTHIREQIVPKCEPTRHPFLPDMTGRGWRADLGVQEADETQLNRFTTWITKVAAFGALSYFAFIYLGDTISKITERGSWNGHGESSTDGWMKAMVRQRQQMAVKSAQRRRGIEKRATAIQRRWRDRAYAPPRGAMYLRDLAGAGVLAEA